MSDKEAVFEYRSDAITNKYQGWIPNDLIEVEQFIANMPKEINTPETWFQLVILLREKDKLIGDIGIHFIDQDNQQCEIGCTISKGFQAKGYATEALRAVLDYLFRDLNKHRIVTSIDPDNTNSIKLVEKLGFRKEAHHKESLFMNGQWVDDLVYALLKQEWNGTARNRD